MKTMKHIFIALSMVFVLSSCMSLYDNAYSQNYNDEGAITFQTFYDELYPYGTWINNYEYGYIWVPGTGRDFHPYATNGYWAMTDYGNTWISNYRWGWAPFHYGRWYYDNSYGWAWVPGYEWAPAWVSWRSGGGYYGWAPIGPRGDVSIYANLPLSYWIFLPDRYMYQNNMYRYYAGPTYRNRIYNNTTIINNTYVYNDNRYYSGPTAGEYRRTSGRDVTVRSLGSSTRSGRSSVNSTSVNVYRPKVSRSSTTIQPRTSGTGRSSSATSTGRSSGSSVSGSTSRNTGNSGNSTSRSSSETSRSNSNSSTVRKDENSSGGRSSSTERSNVNSSSNRSNSSGNSRSSSANSSRTTSESNNNASGNSSGRSSVSRSSSTSTRSSSGNSTRSDSKSANTERSSSGGRR